MVLPQFKHFYFIRHGRTAANELHLMAGGSNDLELNPVGHTQAQNAAKIIAAKCSDIQTICVSTMTRAKQTASYIQKELPRPIVHVPELIEWCFGNWEGQSWHDVAHHFLGEGDPVGGETRQAFRERVYSGVCKSLQNTGPILIVAHGGVWYKIQKLFNLPLMKTDNCQIFKIISNQNNDSVEYSFHEIYI